MARRVSPLTHVRAGFPPIITIHGDADPTVPCQRAVRLRDPLDRHGVPYALMTIPGGTHGGFREEDEMGAFAAIEAFLRRVGVW